MKQYHKLINEVLTHGTKREDRTGTGTISLFSPTEMRFDLREGFPLLTTKKLHAHSIVGELLWMLSGSTNNKVLNALGVSIWNEWAKEDGDLGPIYGKQWRNFNGVDQISSLVQQIKDDPFSRRHIVSAWNPTEIGQMSLPPCHTMFQVYINNNEELSLKLYQRSADVFLGVPYNIASYSLLAHMLAEQTGYYVGEFIHSIGDGHIYLNHVKQAKKQFQREPKELCDVILNPDVNSIFDYTINDISFDGYEAHPHISGAVSV